MTHRFVAYYRVSRQSQGIDGLGIHGQRAAVAQYLNGGSWELVGEFTEVESTRKERPKLAEAISHCQLTGAKLVIAKLDRLARDVEFLGVLKREGVAFVCCDNPHATNLTLTILMAVAEDERERISARTKVALGVIKARLAAKEKYVSRRSGKTIKRLGNPKGLSVSRPDLGAAAVVQKADAFARRVRPIAADLRGQGLSLASVAERLTEMRVQTPRGKAWTAMAVKRVLERA